ncbi:MAG: beta-galactosidase [Lachnospiraceae bacterium]|nr:beta-galactosidase [Lachnospiraceae bacterium]
MVSKVPTRGKLLYGGDYNPEQWLDRPDILAEDIRLMKEAHVNVVSMGIFSWASLEPSDGNYDFSWLKERIDSLYENGIYTILATPTGSRPAWLAKRYPEVLRVNDMGQKLLFGDRHNHCMTSPAYRKKTYEIDRRLSEAFGKHPGVIAWHINNEMGGECYCPLCREAFRNWLKDRYGCISNLNRAWNAAFWSHTFTSFEEIDPPMQIGETQLHGLKLDWKRFITERHKDFTEAEIRAVRDGGSDLPITMNLMYDYKGLDYQDFTDICDFMSWDNYPVWGKHGAEGNYDIAIDTAFDHDRVRSLQRKPYLMMESCPSATNWQSVSKLKEPGLLMAQELQAIAHGADGGLYFQMRQSRGASEKFHGALIDHYGKDDTRVFREAAETGRALECLSPVIGSEVKSRAAVIYDMQNRWAMEDAQGPRNAGLYYREACRKSYRAFREFGLNADLIDETQSLDGYRIVAAPMVYMFREGFADKLQAFVEKGGCLILTYWSGIVDDTDLCFLDGTPHDLVDVCGFRSTEIDGLYDEEWNEAVLRRPDLPECGELKEKTYRSRNLCEILELHGAEALLTYKKYFYRDTPAVTRNFYGKGRVYGIATDFDYDFYRDFYRGILKDLGKEPILKEIPSGLEVTEREGDDGRVYIFLISWKPEKVEVQLPEGAKVVYQNERVDVRKPDHSDKAGSSGRAIFSDYGCLVISL